MKTSNKSESKSTPKAATRDQHKRGTSKEQNSGEDVQAKAESRSRGDSPSAKDNSDKSPKQENL
jgi:hypothetical protein